MQKKGKIDFRIFLLLLLLLIPFFTKAVSIYDSNDGTTFKAYSGGTIIGGDTPPINTIPPTTGGSIFTGTQITQISASDDSRMDKAIADASISSNRASFILLNATLNNVNTTTSLNWTWEGQFADGTSPASNDNNASFWIWNVSGSNWYNCALDVLDGSTDVIRNCYINYSVSDFIDGNSKTYLISRKKYPRCRTFTHLC